MTLGDNLRTLAKEADGSDADFRALQTAFDNYKASHPDAPPPPPTTPTKDLIPISLSWMPAAPKVGDEVTFVAQIKNAGNTDIVPKPGGWLGLSFWVDGIAVSWSSLAIDAGMKAGETKTFTALGGPNDNKATWKATAGTHTIEGHVDDINVVAEVGPGAETNNNIATVLTIAGTSPTPPPVPTPVGKALFGFYRNAGAPVQVHALEADLGRKADVVVDFYASEPGPVGAMYVDNYWDIDFHAGQPYNMMWSVQMGADGVGWADVAAGTYDAQYKALAQHMVDKGFAEAYLRMDHEMNLKPQRGSGQAYTKAARRIWGVMMSVPGAKFHFVWNPNLLTNWDTVLGWPGDDIVEFVGVDVYDVWGAYDGGTVTTAKRDATWSQILNNTYGLNWYAKFCRDHGKKLLFPEWGVANGGPRGGGDNPTFVQRLYDWMVANRDIVAGQFYFDYSGDDIVEYGWFDLDKNPLSKVVYKRLFVQQGL